MLQLRSRSDSLGGADPRAQGRLPRLAGSNGLLDRGPLQTATIARHSPDRRCAGLVGEGGSRPQSHSAPQLLGRAHCSPQRQWWPAGRSNPGSPTRGCTRRPAAGLYSPAPRRVALPPLRLTANSHRPDCIINVNGAASMSCAGSLGLLLCDTYTGILTRESSITTGVENQPVRDSFQMPREAERLQDCFIKVTENKNY